MFGSSDHYSNAIGIRALVMERGTTTTKWKYNTNTSSEVAPNCPRCASTNTKFCYYNNYSLSQPRYFCKACRRYWTKGGSLRNVPIGGGCRKSRRARAAARHQGRSSAGPILTPMGHTDDGGACIDMAAVFAKYVNHDGEINEESDSPGGSSGSSSDYNVQTSCSLEIDSQVEDVTLMFEYQKPLDLLVNGGGGGGGGDHDQIQQVMIPHFSTCQDVIGQDYLYQDCNANFELQQVDSVLGDELVADILWSEGTALPNLGSQQPLMQLQEFGLLSTDDHLRMSANLVPDNWGSFDLSAYDFYSTP